MRVLVTATMAASVLAIGFGMQPAHSVPLSGAAAGPDTAIHKVQMQEKMAPGQGGQGQMAPQQGGLGMSPGGKISPGGKTQGQMRGQGGERLQPGERKGFGPQIGRERRGHARGLAWRHYGGRDWEGHRGYGYLSGCGWLRQRALSTGSHYWWRRYRACLR